MPWLRPYFRRECPTLGRKRLSVSLFTYLAVRLGIGKLLIETSWSQVQGLGVLGGIGFTVSLFITGLAFNDPALIDLSKVGIFAASIVVA